MTSLSSAAATHTFSVDYWRNIEMCVTVIENCAIRKLLFFYSHSIAATALFCIISEIKR